MQYNRQKQKQKAHKNNSYMILLAMTALLSFPFVISHRFNKSRMTITKNLFSCHKPKIFITNVRRKIKTKTDKRMPYKKYRDTS